MKATNQVLASKIGTELTLKVVILKIIFSNEENYYNVCECQDDNGNIFVATGKFPSHIYEGQSYEFIGNVVFQRGSNQLSVTKYKNILPFDKNAMIRYLSTLPGIKSKAITVYQQYGKDSINILRTDPNRVVKEIKGIGKITAMRIKEALDELSMSEESILKLLEYGLTPTAARKLYDLYNDKIIDMIESNPYFLLYAIKGYGFNKCDAIAEQVGYDMRGLERLMAGIRYTLELAAQNDGHCYLPEDELINKACELLSKRLSIQTMSYILDKKMTQYRYGNQVYDIDLSRLEKNYNQETKTRHFGIDYRYKIIEITPDEIESCLLNMYSKSMLINDDFRIYLPTIYTAERYVEQKIRNLNMNNRPKFLSLNKTISEIETRNGLELEPEQKGAIKTFLDYDKGVFCLTGSAGCGKTFTMKLFIEAAKLINPKIKIRLFAPTGKAAKVLQNATGYPCMTIHRGLEYNPELGFVKNESNPIDTDIAIVDEASMIDIELLYHFLQAIKDNTKVIFLGDVNQLQSVGCGNVLHDLLNANSVRVEELRTIKRQEKDSGIIMNANNVIKSITPNNDYNDFSYIVSEDEDYIMEDLINTYMLLFNSGISIEDIQILTPQKNNRFGTYYLNKKIQSLVNKRTSIEIPYKTVADFTLSFKEGDKVIHIKNNYDKQWFKITTSGYEPIDEFGVFNGDCGIIESIYLNPANNKKEMFVRYDDKYIRSIDDDLEELELAYALTIHKSQGSEWQYVLVPMLRQHYAMLNKHILYTAITRAKVGMYLFAQKSAIKTALERSNLKTRYTNLQI